MSNNRILPLVVLFFTLASCGVKSSISDKSAVEFTEDSVSVTLQGKLDVCQSWDSNWIHRYDADVEALAAKAAADPNSEIDVLFFGSSSIRLWKDLAKMMAPLTVVNRGYGGATVRDILMNYDKIMADYSPKAFVIFCDNDICGNPDLDLSVAGVLDHYRLLFNKLADDYPGVPVYFLSWKYSECRAGLRDTQKLLNDVMKDYMKTQPGLTFVDVNSTLLLPDGNVNGALFESDNLHINRDGYLLWTSVLKPYLLENCKNVK